MKYQDDIVEGTRIIQIMPAVGWKLVFKQRFSEFVKTVPLVGFGLTNRGDIVPLIANGIDVKPFTLEFNPFVDHNFEADHLYLEKDNR